MAKGNPLAELDAAVAAVKTARPPTWFDRQPPEAQEIFLAARDKWRSGGYTVRRFTLARVLIEYAVKNGWDVCDAKRMSEWLEKPN
jgi:hypothetical protein